MRENPGFAATVPVAPPLSRRGLRSWHPSKKMPGCKAQRRSANRASRRCSGSLLIACRVPHTRMSPCRRGHRQPQPAALTVQGK
ncbi:putative ydaA protein [Escherichia coli MP021017.9]|nr:putative ydaA protein [Escherichia coli MP021017.9]EMU72922.1 putative ydaA protein [Escherichia coli MP021017.6]EMV07672.1 putative ydaA protein [Escherichia coli MP021017.12]EMV92466.1 putative ydaA protein [Escherichia coli 2861200]